MCRSEALFQMTGHCFHERLTRLAAGLFRQAGTHGSGTSLFQPTPGRPAYLTGASHLWGPGWRLDGHLRLQRKPDFLSTGHVSLQQHEVASDWVWISRVGKAPLRWLCHPNFLLPSSVQRSWLLGLQPPDSRGEKPINNWRTRTRL